MIFLANFDRANGWNVFITEITSSEWRIGTTRLRTPDKVLAELSPMQRLQIVVYGSMSVYEVARMFRYPITEYLHLL